MRFFLILLSFLIISPAHALSLNGFDPCAADNYVPIAQRPTKSVLYAITRCNQPTSYIFGTFHSDSPALAPLIAKAEIAIKETKQIALELVITPMVQQQAAAAMTLPAKHPGLKAILPPELWQQTTSLIGKRLGLLPEHVDQFKPWALAVLVQYPPQEADGMVLDQKLQMLAQGLGHEAIGLETIDEQLSVFETLSEADQIAFLKSAVAQIGELTAVQLQLKKLYLAQDLPAIAALSEEMFEELRDMEPNLAGHLESALLSKRNGRMAERITPLLAKPTFVAIGALHLPGDDGLLHLLEQQGYYILAVE